MQSAALSRLARGGLVVAIALLVAVGLFGLRTARAAAAARAPSATWLTSDGRPLAEARGATLPSDTGAAARCDGSRLPERVTRGSRGRGVHGVTVRRVRPLCDGATLATSGAACIEGRCALPAIEADDPTHERGWRPAARRTRELLERSRPRGPPSR